MKTSQVIKEMESGQMTSCILYCMRREGLVSRPGAMQLEMQLTVSAWMYMNSF